MHSYHTKNRKGDIFHPGAGTAYKVASSTQVRTGVCFSFWRSRGAKQTEEAFLEEANLVEDLILV